MHKITAYTDGACSGNPGPMGAGVLLMKGDIIKQIATHLGSGTNNIAELTAISLALTAIKVSHRADSHVTVYSDSQYAIGVLSKNWKARANVELVLSIKELMREFAKVEFVKVPAHCTDKYNEWADNLAKHACTGNKINSYA